jgi:hypothetical protein
VFHIRFSNCFLIYLTAEHPQARRSPTPGTRKTAYILLQNSLILQAKEGYTIIYRTIIAGLGVGAEVYTGPERYLVLRPKFE